MIPARRVVFDTNLLVSLYVFGDVRLRPLRDVIESRRWQAITRDDCLEEFRHVLAYPHFKLDGAAQRAAFAAYGAVVDTFAQAPVRDFALPRCSDRDDQKFLELTRDSGADWLVSSDKALLSLARRSKMAGRFGILTPEQALADAEALSGS